MSARSGTTLKPGNRAPDFRAPLLDGGEASLSELTADGPVVLVFFKVSCPVCQLTLPFVERLHQAGSVPVYGVSQNDADATLDFHREYGLTLPSLLDPEDRYPASNGFGIANVPTLFVVEPGLRVSRVIPGWHRGDLRELGAAFGAAVIRDDDVLPEWKAG